MYEKGYSLRLHRFDNNTVDWIYHVCNNDVGHHTNYHHRIYGVYKHNDGFVLALLRTFSLCQTLSLVPLSFGNTLTLSENDQPLLAAENHLPSYRNSPLCDSHSNQVDVKAHGLPLHSVQSHKHRHLEPPQHNSQAHKLHANNRTHPPVLNHTHSHNLAPTHKRTHARTIALTHTRTHARKPAAVLLHTKSPSHMKLSSSVLTRRSPILTHVSTETTTSRSV